jgi:SpoVK/Ycf46/Vps4 family AAA+-type ATPase
MSRTIKKVKPGRLEMISKECKECFGKDFEDTLNEKLTEAIEEILKDAEDKRKSQKVDKYTWDDNEGVDGAIDDFDDRICYVDSSVSSQLDD